MACVNGRVPTNEATKRRLFAFSGGYCQRPECHATLFPDDIEKVITIGEIAHIIAANDDGPRADTGVENEARANYDNLILLCPNCHTIIDKAPEEFPVQLIRDWKASHEERLSEAFGIAECNDRDSARNLVEPLFAQNAEIFKEYGPDNDYRHNPEAPEAAVWKRKMRSQIIPNNKQVLLILDANRQFLTEGEKRSVEQFRQHVDDLISKHVLEGDDVAARFPEAIVEVFS